MNLSCRLIVLSFAVTVSLGAQCVIDEVESRPASAFVTAAVSADFDHDGTTDLVLGGQQALFQRGVPGGGFENPKSIGSATPELLALADFNGDGNMDVVGGGGAHVWIELGDGKGGFTEKSATTYAAIHRMRRMVTGRFSGPGSNADVLVFDDTDAAVLLFKGHGDGTFDTPVRLDVAAGATGERVSVADLDGDGNDDVVLTEFPDVTAVTVLRNKGDGTFEKKFVAQGTHDHQLSVADVDRDGINDFIVLNGSNLDIIRGLGSLSYAAPVALSLPYPVSELAVGDVNADGLVDIDVNDPEGDRLAVAYGSGDGKFRFATSAPASIALTPIVIGYTGTTPLIHGLSNSASTLTTWKTVCSRRRSARLH